MKILFFSTNYDTIEEFKARDEDRDTFSFFELDALLKYVDRFEEFILIADYDSVAADINKMIATNKVVNNLIVLERVPEIVTGKMLISHGIKAYGNSRMLKLHYQQMLKAVESGKVWTYPELTAALAKQPKSSLTQEGQELLTHRLTAKEKEVALLILQGLTNDAIAQTLDITTRTVKAHVSAIFSKLHVSDRVALVLLLK